MRSMTTYQTEMLRLIAAGSPDGPGLIDFDQLLARLSWKPTKQAAQFSIRALIGKGLIEKTGLQVRRGRGRVCFALTDSGKKTLDPRDHLPTKTTFVPEIDLADPLADIKFVI